MNSEVKQVFGTAENSHHYIMTALIVMLILNGIGDLGTAGDGLLSHGATNILAGRLQM